MKRKIYKKILIFQIILWICFALVFELSSFLWFLYDGFLIMYIFQAITLILIIRLHFKKQKKNTNKLGITRLRYNTLTILFGNITNIIISLLIFILINTDVFCIGSWDCFGILLSNLLFFYTIIIASIFIIIFEVVYKVYKLKSKK